MLDLFDSSLYEIWGAYTEYLVADQAVTVEKKLIEAIISDRKTLTKIYDLLVKSKKNNRELSSRPFLFRPKARKTDKELQTAEPHL